MKLFVYIVIIILLLIVAYYVYASFWFKKHIMKKDSELKYFLWSEFDSPAMPDDKGIKYTKHGKEYLSGSGKANMNRDFVHILDNVRDNIQKWDDANNRNVKFVIDSGYRTPQYNSTLNDSVPDSAHTKGLAVDISTKGWTNAERNVVIDEFKKAGIQRFGIGSNFIHVDNDLTKPHPAIWTY